MNDTQKYIQAYQKALPHFKEKVVAALLMLVMSAAMATSATFAWISLSTAPEVSEIQTTVAANGNLEIALSDKDGAEPEKSLVGDSGKNLVAKNITWGNLVNLSDESYGLDNLDLRPAELNLSGNLLTTPLKVVTYGSDGRADKFSSSLKYANWDTASQEYLVPNIPEYGVRAITTVTYKNLTGNTEYADMVTELDAAYSAATNIYMELINDEQVLEALKGLIGAYVQTKISSGTSPDVTQYVPALYDMMVRFGNYVEAVGGVMCDIAYMQQYPHFDKDNREDYTLEELLAASDSELAAQKVKLPFRNDYKTLRTELAKKTAELKVFADSNQTVLMKDIYNIVNYMVDIPSTTIGGTPASEIGVSNAANYLGKLNKAVITKGAIKDMEQLTGAKMFVSEIAITVNGVPLIGSATVRASVETNAASPFPLVEAKTGVDNYEGGFAGGDAVANDTYAMAIDFWLRTNSSNAYVVLEGNPVIGQVEKKVNGETVLDENQQPVLVDAVTGYEGVNRVWDDPSLSEYSTTQGNGSCYVFYSDDPAEQRKTLELVAAMKVAFVDEKGKALAHAYMDTANAYQATGKVTVPLVLDNRSVPVLDYEGNEVIDSNGNTVYAVAQMEKNVPQRITAIFYVDGTELSNENVLADGKIQGQLNIQFGMNEQMAPATDDELKYEEYLLTATVSKNSFNYDTDTDLSTEVTLNVSGFEPASVKANFIRKINDLQGSREPQITFQPTGEQNKWKTTMTFDSPGNYILREVILDGVTYELEQPVEVTVEGNGIKSLYCDRIQGGNSHTIMTADSSVEAVYDLVMASTTNKAHTIQGVIFDDSGKQIITDFVSQAGSYTTKVKFNSSGTYTMEFLIIDGEWYEIEDKLKKELELYLGMRAEVKLSETKLTIKGPQSVNVSVEVFNDMGDEISGDVIAEELGIGTKTETDTGTGTSTGVEIKYQHTSIPKEMPDADLIWVAERDRYEGELLIEKAGIYNFSMLKLGSNSIMNAVAPVIEAISPDPPEYRGATVESYQFKPDKDAAVTVDIFNSSGATVNAVIVNDKTGIEYTVTGEEISNVNNIAKRKFKIPVIDAYGKETDNGSQDGNWTLKALKLINVYVGDVLYEEDKPLIWTLADMESGNLKTKVVSNIHVTVKEAKQDVTAYSSKFMGEGTVNDIQITISDFAGEAIDGVSDVKLRYQLTSRDTTAYSTGSQLPHEIVQIVDATLAEGSKTVYNVGNVVLKYPGRYSTGVQFTLNGNPYIAGVVNEGETANFKVAELPSYTMAWEKPVIKVSGTTPNKTTQFDAYNGSSVVKVYNEYSDYSFKVYNKFSSSSICGGTVESLDPPKVALKIFNAGSFSKAEFTMASDKHSVKYTFTKEDTAVNKDVIDSGGVSYSTLYSNGVAQTPTNFDEVVLTSQDGIVYTVKLDNPINAHTPY